MSARALSNRGQLSRQPAIRARGAQGVHQPRAVHQIAQPTAKEQVSADLLEFPIKHTMRLTGASIDTVKAWRAGRRFPSNPYLQKLEPHFESVQAYMRQQFPHSMAAAHPESAEALAAAFQQFLITRQAAKGD
jgi:capsule polysaccharide export protein KpsE/RkpR